VVELERKVRLRDDSLERLRVERDQLVQISSELRAELNRNQRLVNDLMA